MLLTIDTDRYVRASHGALRCSACHEFGYGEIPHRGPGHRPTFLCVSCHSGDESTASLELDRRKSDLETSVHGREAGTPLDCHDCHEPHYFQPVRGIDRALPRISASNAICLECHGASRRTEFSELANVEALHRRFPNRAAHFRKVKCVACHTDVDSATRHDVRPKDRAQKDCVACHSRESALLEKIYQRPDGETTNPKPATTTRVEDHAYVIGSTRSPLLDRLSILGFALTTLLIGAHAIARAVHARRRSRDDEV